MVAWSFKGFGRAGSKGSTAEAARQLGAFEGYTALGSCDGQQPEVLTSHAHDAGSKANLSSAVATTQVPNGEDNVQTSLTLLSHTAPSSTNISRAFITRHAVHIEYWMLRKS